jgi:16S rRNA processing protein RimM
MKFIGNIHSKPTQKVGFVMKTNGYKGWLRVFHYEEASKLPEKGDYLLVNPEGKWVPFLIEDVSDSASLVKLKHLDSDESASFLAGCDILEFSDESLEMSSEPTGLEGYDLLDQNGVMKGTILQLIEMPGHEVLEIEFNKENLLVPFHDSLIIEIDDEKKIVWMNWPEGLDEL